MGAELARAAGRRAFGRSPAAYAAARPPYPAAVYRLLRRRCGLGPGTRTFEIGAGTGLATRELLRAGAEPLVAVEPDPRLAGFLARELGGSSGALRFVRAPFEGARLPPGRFDLGVAATMFHWLSEEQALRKVARLLRPGGWWACWWNVFGDPAGRAPIHRALGPVFAKLPRGPSSGAGRGPPPALDRTSREAALRVTGSFDRISSRVLRWSLELDPDRAVGLYATFAPISTLPSGRRRAALAEVRRVVREELGGRTTLPMRTPVYTARRS